MEGEYEGGYLVNLQLRVLYLNHYNSTVLHLQAFPLKKWHQSLVLKKVYCYIALADDRIYKKARSYEQ